MDKKRTKSFTEKFKYTARSIKTYCQISEAFVADVSNDRKPKFEKANALWDTGATSSCISNQLAEKLHINPIGFEEMYHANGSSIVPTYLINILLPNEIGFYHIHVLGCDLHNMDAIIGMDIISQGDFAISNFEGKTFFSFRIQSTQNISFG